MMDRFATRPDVLASERRMLPKTARARLDRLLQEIDETVLPRRFRVQCKNTPDVELVVANRRLVAITARASRQATAHPLKPSAEAFGEALLDLAKRARALTKAPHRQGTREVGTENSFTAAALRQTLGLDVWCGGTEALAGRLNVHAKAQLTWDAGSKKLQFKGDTVWKPCLRHHAALLTQQMNMSRPSSFATPRDVVGLAAPISHSEILISAYDGSKGVAVISPRDAGLAAISEWQMVAKAN